jgi:SAM-dependent methyltransferase
VTRPFRTAATYYDRYRPAYPPELIARLAEATGLDRESRVLDLGCGPGTVAVPLSAYAGEVVAVDVEPEMLGELRRLAPENVTAVEARAEQVDESWGSFQLVTAGRSFHWFDADVVFERLSAITPAVALLGDDMRKSDAQMLALRLAAELSEVPQPERRRFRYPDILAASPFSDVEVISVPVERTWTQDQLIGLVYSTARFSPERLGDRRPEFERRVRAELKDQYREQVSVQAVVGRLRH